MDIRSYFGSSSKPSASVLSSSVNSSCDNCSSSEEEREVPPTKKPCVSKPELSKKRSKYHTTGTSSRKYQKRWEEDFTWLEYDADFDGAFCKLCKTYGKTLERTGGVWTTKPFTNWKKAVEKMRAHAKSDSHITASQAAIAYHQGSHAGVIQLLGKVAEQERLMNRAAVKSFFRCAHFLARQHIPHTTNFKKLVDLVVSCGGEDLKNFLDRTGRNAVYTSHVAVVEFMEAIGTWIEESLLERLRQASCFSIMADECTDVATIEEMSVYCRWEEGGSPEEHFLEIIHLKQANAESIYSSLVECLKDKDLQVSKIVGMGFDGASTFSGKKTGVQARIKKLSPHALFVHCHCHLLQLACVHAANSTNGIKHVYVTLTALWKFFHYSPKRAESLKMVQQVLDLPELKIAKPSDTRWLAHERCVKAVKASYGAIVIALNDIYENTHEPESLGLSKALSKQSTIVAIYMLDYALPQVAKLSRTLQAEHLDLSVISSLVDATLHTLDDAVLTSANWVQELLDEQENLEEAAGIKVTLADITTFQEKVTKPFIAHLKENVSSRFASSSDIVSALSIFDPRKAPKVDSPDLPQYGEQAISILMAHYGAEKPAETLLGEPTNREAVISSDITTEWKTYRQLLVNMHEKSMKLQLKELVSNDMMRTLFPNLSKIATISLSIPVSTASVERSFSQMKLIKSRLRSSLSNTSLSHLMKIAIESPAELTDIELEGIVDVWKKKSRRIIV